MDSNFRSNVANLPWAIAIVNSDIVAARASEAIAGPSTQTATAIVKTELVWAPVLHLAWLEEAVDLSFNPMSSLIRYFKAHFIFVASFDINLTLFITFNLKSLWVGFAPAISEEAWADQ